MGGWKRSCAGEVLGKSGKPGKDSRVALGMTDLACRGGVGRVGSKPAPLKAKGAAPSELVASSWVQLTYCQDSSTTQPGAQRTREKKPGCFGQDDRFEAAVRWHGFCCFID